MADIRGKAGVQGGPQVGLKDSARRSAEHRRVGWSLNSFIRSDVASPRVGNASPTTAEYGAEQR